MSPSAPTTPAPLRVAAVWLTTAAATSATLVVGAPAVVALAHARAAVPFDQLLVGGCAVLATVGCLVLLGSTTSVVVGLCTGRLPRRVGPLRRAILTACGAAVLATVVPATAHATSAGHRHGSAIAGLPLPDRATGVAAGPAARQVAHVQPGDSLWAIARSRLGGGASDAEVAAYCSRLYDRNAAAVGTDPDLIVPGLRLELPPTRHPDR